MDDENKLWLGVGTYGLGVKDRKTGKFTFYTQMPEFAGYTKIPTVMSIKQYSVNGHIWVAAYNGGIYEIDKHVPVAQRVKKYTSHDVEWLSSNYVYNIFEDLKHNLWFVTRNGVSMRNADGKAVRFDSLQVGNSLMKTFLSYRLSKEQTEKYGELPIRMA
ncbi:MAG: hypothetical protein LUE99_05400 [Bacteroides sp.]|nr:hypothetical protein [Bacteroides sp.]